jgi:transcriptional regulator with XRE-family HTH domain
MSTPHRRPKTAGLAARLTAAIHDRKMTAEDIRSDIGAGSTEQIYRWMRGESEPRLESFARICRAVGVSADHLLFGEGEP